MSTSSPDADLVVLGAGPAGLGAAHRATKAGHRVVVLERDDRVGGAAASHEIAGVRVDLGSHRLHRAIDPEIVSDLRTVLGDDLQRRHRRGRIRLAGRWLAFPLRPGDLLANLPPGFASRAALDLLTGPLRRGGGASFDARVRARLGPTMADRFYGPYARKLWGLDPTEIDARQADVRISAASARELLARILGGGDRDGDTFLYPRRGFGQICEALADAATTAGTDIRLRTAAVEVASRDDGVTITTQHGRRLTAHGLFSTIPLPALAALHEPAPPAPVAAAARSLHTRAMVLVYLVLDVPRYTRFDAHYLPETWTPVTRVSEPKNYRDGRPGPDDPGDRPDRTVLCAEIPCEGGDRVWDADDDVLGAVAGAALTRAGLPDVPVGEVHTARLPSAYPVYRRGFTAALDEVDAWAARLPRVLTFGRQGLFVHDNTHHALAMAWAAADALEPGGGFDEDAWRRARLRFEDHVVED